MKTTAMLVAALIITGCTQPADQTAEIASLRTKLEAQANRISTLEKTSANLARQQLANTIAVQEYKSVTLDPAADTGFGRLDTSVMALTISMKDVSPFADGSRLVLSVGNMSTATVNSSKFTVKYGVRAPEYKEGDNSYSDKYSVWAAGLRERQEEVPNKLMPGTWNTVSINLPGVKPSDLGYIQISGEVSQISLRQTF